MSNSAKLFISLIGLALILGAGAVLAQVDATEAINLDEDIQDEDIQPEDLEISEPWLLPDHPLYFLKNWGRGIRSFFTFNPVRKAELKSKFANEKLIELKKMVEEKKDPEVIKAATENYQKEIEKIKKATEEIEETAKENPEVEKFLDKFVKHQVLHQRLLQRLENQVPSEAFEKIKTARERHLERFAEVMTKLEDRMAKVQERLEEKMEEIEGSKYKNFKNLEVLLELEEKVPEPAKEAIQKAQENALKRLQGDLELMSPEDQEKFKDYLERIGGVKEIHLEILENLKSELKEKPEIIERIIGVKGKIIEKVREEAIKINCPEVEKPAPDFCQEGRIVVKRDDQDCLISFECLIPAEIEIPPEPEKPQVCITLWDPVCGVDGKTYSNSCFAKLAGIEIAYKEMCVEEETILKQSCDERCKALGYSSGICGSARTDPMLKKCESNEIYVGRTIDCENLPHEKLRGYMIGSVPRCCCKK